jgi:hypothetical protein
LTGYRANVCGTACESSQAIIKLGDAGIQGVIAFLIVARSVPGNVFAADDLACMVSQANEDLHGFGTKNRRASGRVEYAERGLNLAVFESEAV